MDILQIVENENAPEFKNHFKSCITVDRKSLCLSYAIYDSDESGYDDLFDQLDLEEKIYDKLETLILETDHIHKIPDHVLQFKNLKKINIMGSRFWDLDLTQVPGSVEVLILIDHTNLPLFCLNGMEKLINLTDVHLDKKPFDNVFSNVFEYSSHYGYSKTDTNINRIYQIPDLPKLKTISFHTGISYDQNDLKPYWRKILKNHHMFSKIKTRITNICLDYDNISKIMPIIKITL